MHRATRLRCLAALALFAVVALAGGVLAPAGAEETYDCSLALFTCDEAVALCSYLSPTPQVLGPCSDGDGQLALVQCERYPAFCRTT